ncbi:MAG: helix-turn-helix domain-containing protein [Paludibacter sp.]|jgi:hypothetical protein
MVNKQIVNVIMSAQIITLEDLYEFKTQLLEDIRIILNNQKDITSKKWLKSVEVRKMLNISPGTLQTLRINGTLPYTKIGGTMYYNFNDIEKLLNKKQ